MHSTRESTEDVYMDIRRNTDSPGFFHDIALLGLCLENVLLCTTVVPKLTFLLSEVFRFA